MSEGADHEARDVASGTGAGDESEAAPLTGAETARLRDRARPPLPFRAKLTLVGALLVIVPLSVVGYLVVTDATRTVEKLNRQYRAQIAGNIQTMIEAVLRSAQDGLDATGHAIGTPGASEDHRIALAQAVVAGHATLDHVAIYDYEGALIDVLRERGAPDIAVPETLDASVRAEAEGVNMGTGGSLAQGDRPPRVLLAVPIRMDGRMWGYAASYVSLVRVQALVERLALSDFEGDDVFVVDSAGKILVHLDRERAIALDDAPELEELLGPEARSETQDFIGVGQNVNARGEETVSTALWSHLRRFTIVVQVPVEKAYAAPRAMRGVILTVIAAAILLALLAAFVVARQISKPIQALSEFAQDLAERRWDRRVTLKTLDEFGQLGDAMSAAAADLQASEERIREEHAIRGDLGRYLPAEVVDKVVRREQDMGLGGRRREISVLFADVVAFTPLTDRLAAEEIVALLNELFTILTEIVFRHGGTIDKFIGDCVMAVWGAAESMDDHADRALEAAEDMIRFLEVGNEGWKEKYGVTIEIAVGVNSGEAIVGNIGSETRMEYTAIGDTVNVAARLESIARPQQILATQATVQRAEGGYEFVDLGEREMTGRAEPIHVFEVRL